MQDASMVVKKFIEGSNSNSFNVIAMTGAS